MVRRLWLGPADRGGDIPSIIFDVLCRDIWSLAHMRCVGWEYRSKKELVAGKQEHAERILQL